jgi:phosphatidylinositol kinase/protein kinase (PI-3  family)
VGTMVDAGLPCFQHRMTAIESLRSRFFPEMSDSQACDAMKCLIEDARGKWTTIMYDVSRNTLQ